MQRCACAAPRAERRLRIKLVDRARHVVRLSEVVENGKSFFIRLERVVVLARRMPLSVDTTLSLTQHNVRLEAMRSPTVHLSVVRIYIRCSDKNVGRV